MVVVVVGAEPRQKTPKKAQRSLPSLAEQTPALQTESIPFTTKCYDSVPNNKLTEVERETFNVSRERSNIGAGQVALSSPRGECYSGG